MQLFLQNTSKKTLILSNLSLTVEEMRNKMGAWDWKDKHGRCSEPVLGFLEIL